MDGSAWDGFLVGPENALAHAGALALARGEPGAASPLVLHGPSGAGKSRLLAGLVAERLARRPTSALAHLSAESFAAACAEADARPGGWAELRGRFRALDLLALDDLHALDRAPMALAELAHTLDALADVGAAVAVAARDGPPAWSGWPRRLVNRLLGGLSVRVEPPGIESRRRYLLDRSRGLRLSAEAVESLAGAADGYRTLDGWLARLALGSRVEGRPIGPAQVEAALAESGPAAAPTLDAITRDVARAFGLRARDLRGEARHAALVGPRHLAMHLARERTGLSFAAIGRHFGRRDPATVRHACRAAAARLASDPALASAAERLLRRWDRPGIPPG